MDMLEQRLRGFREYLPEASADDARRVAQQAVRVAPWRWARVVLPVVGAAALVLLVGAIVVRGGGDTPPVTQPDVPTLPRTDDTVTNTVRSTPTTETTGRTAPGVTTGRTPSGTVTAPSTSTATAPTPAPPGGVSCGEVLDTSGSGHAIIFAVRDVRGVTCARARALAALSLAGSSLPSPWICQSGECWSGGDPAEAVSAFRLVNGGDAG